MPSRTLAIWIAAALAALLPASVLFAQPAAAELPGGTPETVAAAVDADFLLAGGTIVDGTGGEPYQGDVAVEGTRIVAVGKFALGTIGRTIDCQGLVIAPGFIDIHNHSDRAILEPETSAAASYLTQGCATLVTGNCGGGHRDVEAFYAQLEANGMGVNILHLLPHGSLRNHVMGRERRLATREELATMRGLVDQAMRSGAWGISTGLAYVPGAYADTDELIALSTVVAQYGGIYASHVRDESDALLEAIDETLMIARRSGVHVHVSHLKGNNRQNWGRVRTAAAMIERARAGGLAVTADQYPYNASSTSFMAMLLPKEQREGGFDATVARLNDPAQLPALTVMIGTALKDHGKLVVSSCQEHPQWIGRSIGEIAKHEQRTEVEVALDLLKSRRSVGVQFGMDEQDVRYVMGMPWVATCSDGSCRGDDGQSQPHPRSSGTFPRKIGYYALELKVLPISQAVRSASGLPADILGLPERGYLRPGYVADVVAFDPATFRDQATFDEPHLPATGVRWLFINGGPAISKGKLQPELHGQVLRKEGRRLGDTP